jgi:hypothetical protein
MEDQDKRQKYLVVSTKIPGDLATRSEQEAHDAAVSRSEWVRGLILGALAGAGYHDLARRAAPRRPRRQPRSYDPGSWVPLPVNVSAREKEIVGKVAEAQGMTPSRWLRKLVEDELGEEEGGQRGH